ncbi:MAG: hypothetical protein KKF50_00670 [Nanoarchaeota archaeon]|nr:hypothetical protein [Nanoarchaeota archaeon]
MSKTESRDKIIQLFKNSFNKNKPRGDAISFKEMVNSLGGESEYRYQSVAKILKRLERDGIIAYSGSSTTKVNMKDLLRRTFQRDWPDYAGRIYLYTPKSADFYRRLLKKFGRKDQKLISEILFHYRHLEMASWFAEDYFYNPESIKKEFKAKGKDLTEREIKHKISFQRKQVEVFYKNRNKNKEILRFLRLDPVMYWCAFRTAKDTPPEKNIVKKTTIPMIDKMRKLFLEHNNL